MESIMIEKVDSDVIENSSCSVESPDDAAELISKVERAIKSEKKQYWLITKV